MNTSGHVGSDVRHKLYTFGASACLIIAGINKAKSEGFLAHIAAGHDFSMPRAKLEKRAPGQYSLMNQQLLDFGKNGGKIFVIASLDPYIGLLKEVKKFLKKNRVTYTLLESGMEATHLVVDHENGEIYALGRLSKLPGIERNLDLSKFRKGGLVAAYQDRKTTII